MNNRSFWVKVFQKKDIKAIEKSQKYGNAAYEANTIIAVNDRLSSNMFDYALKRKVPSGVLSTALQGEWHNIAMRCKVERLDSGEWITRDYQFTSLLQKPDFPFEQVKGDE